MGTLWALGPGLAGFTHWSMTTPMFMGPNGSNFQMPLMKWGVMVRQPWLKMLVSSRTMYQASM
jgi:hypothetical protein